MEVKNGKYSAQNKWQAANLEKICLKFNKRFYIKNRIALAAKEAGISSTAYVMQAIETALTTDGYPRPDEGQQDD